MYIPEFICGIAATLLVEFAVLVIAVVISINKKKKH